MSSAATQCNNVEATDIKKLESVEAVLDFIRGNLANIERVWGRDSAQYKSGAQLMRQQLEQNLRKANIHQTDVADLLNKLNLHDDDQISHAER